MPNFKKSKNKTTKPSIKMDPPYNLKPVPKGDKGKGLSELPADVRNNMGYKMDSSHSFKMKDALNMKAMYMGSTYSMEPMGGDKDSSNPFAVDLGKPSKTGSSTIDLGLGKPSGEPSRDIKDIQKNEYREAQDAFNIVGPLDAKDELNKIGHVDRRFVTGSTPPKTTKPTTDKKSSPPPKEIKTSSNGGSLNYTPKDVSFGELKFDKLDVSKSKKIRAITPRETRRNERNVKFLKRRIRKAERKGDNSASLRQSLANAQSQQSGNFLPGDKFTQPSSGSTYQTPKQVKQSKKEGKKKGKLFGKKEGGTNVGNLLRKGGEIFKKKPKGGSGYRGYIGF